MARIRSGAGAQRGSRTGPSDKTDLPPDIADDADADPESTARIICLRLLTVRARTRLELRDALAARGVPDGPATTVLDRLAAVGLIDDEAFAENFVRSRVAERGLAPREIVRQLRSKGVGDEIAGAAVEHLDRDAELATARALALRKLRSMSRLDSAAQSRRLISLLARKGYSSGVCYRVTRDVLQHSSDSSGSDPGPDWDADALDLA